MSKPKWPKKQSREQNAGHARPHAAHLDAGEAKAGDGTIEIKSIE
jgi:hypothetical protein